MKKWQLFSIFFFLSFGALAQTDSLVLSDNDLIIGEIKKMDKNILTIETDYSDVDFKIKWGNIKRVYSKTSYLITLSDGRRYNGRIQIFDENGKFLDQWPGMKQPFHIVITPDQYLWLSDGESHRFFKYDLKAQKEG